MVTNTQAQPVNKTLKTEHIGRPDLLASPSLSLNIKGLLIAGHLLIAGRVLVAGHWCPSQPRPRT